MAKALDALGLQGVKFIMHSFKISTASTTAAIGYPRARIQEIFCCIISLVSSGTFNYTICWGGAES